MNKPETKETWKDALQSFKLQLSHCQDRVKMYKHLLRTQAEPGNLPKSLAKWQQLENKLQDLVARQEERGKRWGYVTDESGTV